MMMLVSVIGYPFLEVAPYALAARGPLFCLVVAARSRSRRMRDRAKIRRPPGDWITVARI
jgi:hypothetical protein